MAHKSSAIGDEAIEVLFALHPQFNLLDFSSAVQVFTTALHDSQDEDSRAFEITVAGSQPQIESMQKVVVDTQINYKDAHARLNDFDVVVVVGGEVDNIINKGEEPLPLILAYAKLQQEDNNRERTLFAMCHGSCFLAKQGLLAGLAATTHPDFMTKFEDLCSQIAVRQHEERTEVMDEARYVVNNLRFEIGDEDDNPYIRKGSERRPSNARKGSMSFKVSNRRESVIRRASMRLGGLRVITSGASGAGVDAALYLVSALVSNSSAEEVADRMGWKWEKGVVMNGIDV